MKKTKKITLTLLITMLVSILSLTTSCADNKSNPKVVYNTKDLELNTTNKDGDIYIPIIALGENLHYTVLEDSATQTVRIYDDLSDIYLNMNGDVKVNNVESKNEQVPILVDSTVYVPLSFVSDNLGIDVDYNAKKAVITMTGRDIYEISQKENEAPYLRAYTKDGRKEVGTIAKDYYAETSIESVRRTKYSDIVETRYFISGAVSRDYHNQIYVKNAEMINNSKIKTEANLPDGEKPIGTKHYDDRVAFIGSGNDGKTYVKVYDDVTGELLNNIDTKELYNTNTTYHGFDMDKEYYGEIDNIQAVGKDFVVVSMFQPFEDARDEEMSMWMLYYYKTVINLETLKMYPVYKNLNYFKEYTEQEGLGFGSGIGILGDTDLLRGLNRSYGLIATDGIYFDGIQEDGTLRFVGNYAYDAYSQNPIKKQEVCSVDYKK